MKVDLNDRPIEGIGWKPPGEDIYDTIVVGEHNVDKIEAIDQYLGEYSIIWLQVWKFGKVVARYNARNVDTIFYAENEK